MICLVEQLNATNIRINPNKIDLAKNQLSHIERAKGLSLSPCQVRETVWQHTVAMLRMNNVALAGYKGLARIINHPRSVAMLATHDFWEGFTDIGDLDHSIPSHNGHAVREKKEGDEYAAAHHYVSHNALDQYSRKLLHQTVDEWFTLKTMDALWIKAIDMVQGNQSALVRHDNPTEHVIKMASKTYPVIEQLIHNLPTKEASLDVLCWFNSTMLTTYLAEGFGDLPYIQTMSDHITNELGDYQP